VTIPSAGRQTFLIVEPCLCTCSAFQVFSGSRSNDLGISSMFSLSTSRNRRFHYYVVSVCAHVVLWLEDVEIAKSSSPWWWH